MIYDILAVGCGPFNLGAAALASTVPDMKFLALDAQEKFSWHSGMMFADAKVQTSFLADLVSIVSPTHPLSFLQYLVDVDRMYPFYIREDFHLTRFEYEDYLKWALSKLDNVRMGVRVREVYWENDHFQVKVEDTEQQSIAAKNLLIGIGTQPFIPSAIADLPRKNWLHTSEYRHRLNDFEGIKDITVVGAGQSGAEVFRDLLQRFSPQQARLNWITRSASFAPLDYTKLVLEMTTPEYVKHFNALSEKKRDELNREQWHHYRGISSDTLEEIYELIYQRSIVGDPNVGLHIGTSVLSAELGEWIELSCVHKNSGQTFTHSTQRVVAATGYRQRSPDFLAPVREHLDCDSQGRLDIDFNHAVKSDLAGKVYVANGDIHTHGVAAPDLGICAWRNARILNKVMERQVYNIPSRTAFTQFEKPELA